MKTENKFKKAITLIEKNKIYCNPDFSIKMLSEKINLSSSELLTLFNKYYGISFFKKINLLKIAEAKTLLKQKKNKLNTISNIANQCGFKSINLFNQIFTEYTQMSPFQYRITKNDIKEKHLNIGILADNFYDYYTSQIFSGIKDNSYQYDYISLFCFLGGSLNSPRDNYKERNFIFDFAHYRNLDGILSISTNLSSYISDEELVQFHKKYKLIPLISIGKKLLNTPSVFIDNKIGMQEILKHVIEFHNCKKIAFITGPLTNIEANERLKIYKDTLRKYNIPVKKDLIIEGNFLSHSGRNAVKTLYQNQSLNIDAIVAANDHMGINAIYQLEQYGIKVPEDIIVTGFDFIPEGQYIKFPITTVRQPCYEMGMKSLDLLIKKIKNLKHMENIIIPSQLIIRNSCGCGYKTKKTLSNLNKKINLSIEDKKYINFINNLNNIFNKKYPGIENKNIIKSALLILNTIENIIQSIEPQTSYKEMLHYFKINIISQKELIIFYDIIYYIFEYIKKTNNKNDKLDKLYIKIILELDNLNLFQNEAKFYKNFQYMKKIGHLNQLLLNQNKFEKILIENLPYYGINSFCISIFLKQTKKELQSIINFNMQKKSLERSSFSIFPTKEIIPGGLRSIAKPGIFVVIPLLFKKEILGVGLFECNLDELMIYEILITQISNSINFFNIKNFKNKKTLLDKKIMKNRERMTEERANYFFNKLNNLLRKEKNFLDPDLNLQKLSEIIKISRNDLSYIINKYTGYNFYDFINNYRIKEAKKMLINNIDSNFQINDIAYLAGFNSKSTFNKFFKKYTFKTPTQFIKDYK